MDWTDLYTGSNELADMIVNSMLFAEYRKCKEQLAACKEAQKEIQNFQVMKEKYEEVMRFGK
ncbi:MAG: YlbF family regulator, partial [Bacilli bacterium]